MISPNGNTGWTACRSSTRIVTAPTRITAPSNANVSGSERPASQPRNTPPTPIYTVTTALISESEVARADRR